LGKKKILEKNSRGKLEKMKRNFPSLPDLANVAWHFTPPYGPHHGGTYEIMPMN